MKEFWVTTEDNPYNPFTQFDKWKEFDEQKGYFTCEYIARIAKTSNDLSEEDYNAAINDAVDEICSYNLLGIYKRVANDTVQHQ